ncbi:FAD-dependent oxidoreductase [Streptosporangium lutulentum]|uniref:2-polyprenyl-6-methoxyphenol hydroxylase-like FAD-dependent oxidoreductase n=1 Tax=Streptosporangium lutulentum TaxID=1461250 RepID=A0ABT9QPM0_9ACTN|nr:FAD-dependent oxidoreductase [Streptosporangium lutulentum]MDP9848712.1 2-polyprenyl-6-methoxyphenol hydroxylase-like FAD-dependent oxidoreductase [Streptosporangium lutulentum]
MNEIQVLIVGAGPTGLTLAIELARRGVSLRIVEKAPEHPVGSRGKGLQPRTQEVFDDLGVIDEIVATGRVYPPIRSYSGDQVVWEGRMHELREPEAAVPYPMVLMQPQWRVERILRERLAELGHHVELGTEVIAFEQDADGVTVTLESTAPDGAGGGAPGGARRVRCAYLAGADGGRSFVRKHLGVGFEGDTFETERMLIGDVRTPDLDREHWHAWADMATRTMRFTLCPLPGTDVFQFTMPFTAEEAPEPSLEYFQKIFDEGSGRTDVRFTDLTWMSLYRVNIRMAERFRVGRVLLAGDAAHVHSPAGGQGLNTGVQDAYNLGWKLSGVLGGAPERLLDTYEEERLPVAADVLGISTRLYARAKRNEQDAHVRDEETQQLLLGYRDGSLAAGERGGERVPDATLEGGRLFDALRGPHFTLLALGTAHASLVKEINATYGAAVRAHTVAHRGEAGDLIDVDGQVHDHYGRGLVLIRPDGYVGYHGDESGLGDYLLGVTAAGA